ncbi:MAG: DUF805 domain-containing protein [Candidatus Nomurabacteria bacterium]
MNHYISAFKNYSKFTGRANREEFWYFMLFDALIIVTLLLLIMVHGLFSIPYLIYAIGVLIPKLAIFVRRLHDINKSGWWFFIVLIPIVGPIWLLVLLCLPSVNEGNKY